MAMVGGAKAGREKVLVVGGAGYVGSAACAYLLDQGHRVWVLDDLSTGHREFVLPGVEGFTRARAGDRERVFPLLQREKFDCVMHFAARSLVSESVKKPHEYHENNVLQTRLLLEAMLDAGTRNFIFSSTCAIFGDPGDQPIRETLPKKPMNPYGETKLAAERVMEEVSRERGLRAIALRYFNAAGSEPQARVGERHEPESHLIPRVLKAALCGETVEVYGTDYPTDDGTCVRDYIHIWDLAVAHEAAMHRLLKSSGAGFEAFNLGSEKGYSVREVIETCQKVTGIRLKCAEKPRRPGDPPRLVADSALAKKELGFSPRFSLEEMISSAWVWERKPRTRVAGDKRAVFLDRDGTINEDPGYLSQPSQMKLLPGVGEALAALKKAGFLLVVVSNQSGVGRGLIELEAIPKIHLRLDELLAPWGVAIDHYELCFHRPEDDCACRKPKPKLIADAGWSLGVDFSRSFMVGDKISDLRSGQAAGCAASLLVRTGEGKNSELLLKAGEANCVADSLFDAARWILSQ